MLPVFGRILPYPRVRARDSAIPMNGNFGNIGNALFGDGSVRALKKSMDEKILHLLIQKSDGQVIPNIP